MRSCVSTTVARTGQSSGTPDSRSGRDIRSNVRRCRRAPDPAAGRPRRGPYQGAGGRDPRRRRPGGTRETGMRHAGTVGTDVAGISMAGLVPGAGHPGNQSRHRPASGPACMRPAPRHRRILQRQGARPRAGPPRYRRPHGRFRQGPLRHPAPAYPAGTAAGSGARAGRTGGRAPAWQARAPRAWPWGAPSPRHPRGGRCGDQAVDQAADQAAARGSHPRIAACAHGAPAGTGPAPHQGRYPGGHCRGGSCGGPGAGRPAGWRQDNHDCRHGP